MTTAVASGPSGGELGHGGRHSSPPHVYEKHPDLVRRVLTIGMQSRTGHDRARWASVNWEDYRAHVGVQQQRGPWSVRIAESPADGVDAWAAEAQGLPHMPGWYTTLLHDERGLVMSDLPGEVAGCLPFLDRLAASMADASPWILIGGLGLGILPAWLLNHGRAGRIDVIEIDPDIIELIARDPAAWDHWASDPRLHVHLGDVHTWQPRERTGCALHPSCAMRGGIRWTAAWWDIWDCVSPGNLPSMHRLHRRFARRVGWQMSWERAECEAMRRRGQTVEHPGFGCLGVTGGRRCLTTPRAPGPRPPSPIRTGHSSSPMRM